MTHKTLKRGSRGPEVVELQNDLIQLKYDVGSTGADGIYGAKTEQAVREFQGSHKDQKGEPLKVDGICGQSTWWSIENALEPQPVTDLYTVIIPHLTLEAAEELQKQYPDAEKRREG